MQYSSPFFIDLTQRIAGSYEVPLRQRMFNIFCLVGILVTLIMGIINLTLSKYLSASISTSIILIFGLGYYLSFSKNKHNIAAPIVFSALMIFLSVNYFLLGGYRGPSDVLFLGLFVGKLLLSPRQHYLFWTITNITVVGLLFFLEWQYPDSVMPSNNSTIADMLNCYNKYVLVSLFIVLGIVIFLKDYERTTQQIIQQKDMLNVLNEEKIRLIAILTHDMKSPMAGIVTYLDALVHVEFPPEKRKQIESLLHTLSKSTLSAMENVLARSKDFYNSEDAPLADVELTPIVQEIHSLYHPLAFKKKITFDCQTDESKQAFIRGNEGLIHLVLRNLLDNALKFTAVNGHVAVSLKPGNSHIQLIVSDSGAGTDNADEAPPLPNTHIDDLISSNSLGLGLTMCKKYIQAMDGTIVCKKNESGGTTFVMEFKQLAR